jgi:hypothetical protein
VGYFTDYFAGYFDSVAPESVAEAAGSAAVDGVSDALDVQWRGQTALDANGLPAPYYVLEDKVGATTDGVAESEGVAVVEAVGASDVEAVAEADGTSEALAESDWLALAEAAGTTTADAAGESDAESVGLAAGSCEALAVSDAPVVSEEQPSGGYGWANLAAIERRRRQRELEEEADRLEVALAAEGLVTPDPVVVVRHQVRSRPPVNYSRRTERAIAYAERAKTLLAYQLALKEIERQEEEDFSVLMAIALAA